MKAPFTLKQFETLIKAIRKNYGMAQGVTTYVSWVISSEQWDGNDWSIYEAYEAYDSDYPYLRLGFYRKESLLDVVYIHCCIADMINYGYEIVELKNGYRRFKSNTLYVGFLDYYDFNLKYQKIINTANDLVDEYNNTVHLFTTLSDQATYKKEMNEKIEKLITITNT